MTLLELLVKELPGRGGWPELAKETIEMHHDGDIFFDGRNVDNFHLPQCSDGWRSGSDKYSYSSNRDSGFWSNEVTRNQYEAALASSQQPAWNGEGLPPVGCECEWGASVDHEWVRVRVLAYQEDEVWLMPLNGSQSFIVGNPAGFRPIRTEADRKREDVGLSIYHAINWNAEGELVSPSRMEDYRKAYDAIAAGKIPGVKLT